MRALTAIVLLAGCAAPPPPVEGPPPTPSFNTTSGLTILPGLTLRGGAPEALVVRITVDRTCEGPALLEVTAEEFETGVAVELPLGRNLFTAQSISATGRRSNCSTPIEVTREIPAPPAVPTGLNVWPATEASSRRFMITGTAPPDTIVQLHTSSCFAATEQTLTPEQFASAGFQVLFDQDGFRTVAIDVIDVVGQRSMCTTLGLRSKTTPPWAVFEHGSPQPTPESSAYYVARGDFLDLEVYAEPDCQGFTQASCLRSTGTCLFTVQQPNSAWEGPFSALLRDPVGNTACVVGLPFQLDVFRYTAPELYEANNQLRVRVHVGRDRLDLFESDQCAGPPVATLVPTYAIPQGLRTLPRPDGGAWTARSYVSQTTPDPCSQPFFWP